MQNTNTNTGTNSFNTASNGGSDQGGISRELLSQQTEILAKIEVLLSNQNRLERALQAALLANNVNAASLTGIDSGVNASV